MRNVYSSLSANNGGLLMNLTTQRRLAASILKVGENRVWIDPNEAEEVSRAITRESVKQLIDQGIIKARPKTGISSYRSKKIKAQKAKGRRKGRGSIKGAKKARTPKKQVWMKTIRALRTDLREMRDAGEIDPMKLILLPTVNYIRWQKVEHSEASLT